MRTCSLMVAGLLVLASGSGRAQDVKSVLDAAAAALGAARLQSIQISGWGSDHVFGQAYDGHTPWPRFHVPAYDLAIDYVTPALREERRRAQAEDPPRGGGFQPLIGEQRPVVFLSAGYAWDLDGEAVVAAEPERDMRSAVEARTTQIWLTPHGFLKAAQTGRTTVRTQHVLGRTETLISVTMPNNVRLQGVLNDQHLVERVETWMDNPVLGDITLEAVYSGYQDFEGVKFPTRIVQRQADYPVLDITVTGVQVNRVGRFDVPESIRTASAPPPFVSTPEQLADGVWSIPLGPRDRSVLIEFRDYLAVYDAPENEAISEIGLAAIAKLLPAKPIRYVINSHTHFDHSGGLRTYAAEGATVVTHVDNVPYYQQVWANPRTIAPDRLARSMRAPAFEGVVGSRTLTDGSRRLVIYHYPGNIHNPGMLMAYLPTERILMQADSFNPASTYGGRPPMVPNLVHFYEAVRRLQLDVEHIVPVHGRITTMEEVREVVETYGGARR